MGKEFFGLLIIAPLKELSLRIKYRVKELLHVSMVKSMKGIGKKTKWKVRANFAFQTTSFTMEILKMIIEKGKECLNGQLAKNFLGSGTRVNSMEWAL